MNSIIKREIRKIDPSKLGLRSIIVESFSELGVGEGNVNYLFKINDKKFICRINIDVKMPTKSRDEYKALKAVECLGVAPKAFYLHKASNNYPFDFIILEYIEGKAFRMKKRTYSTEQINEMAKILAELHSIKDDKLARKNYFYKHYLDGGLAYVELINKRTNMVFESELKNLNNKIKGCLPIGETHEFGLIHGDVCPQNIIETRNGLRLIDWESMQFSDPARDLANVMVDMGLNGQNLEHFLKEYRKIREDHNILGRAKVYEILFRYNNTLWEIVRSFEILSGELPQEYLKKTSAQCHINEAKYQYRKLNELLDVPELDIDLLFAKGRKHHRAQG